LGPSLDVHVIANGKAHEILPMLPDPITEFEVFDSAADVLDAYPKPRIMVSSMCSEGGIGRDLIPLLRGQCPTVVMPDSPWGRYQKEWADHSFWSDWLLVNDKRCESIAHALWHGFPGSQIQRLSWPFLDQFCGYDISAATEDVRLNLCPDNSMPIVLFVGQLNHTSKVLQEVISEINRLERRRVYLIVRLHPRMDEVEGRACEEAMKLFSNGVLISDSRRYKTLRPLIAAADVTVSMYSTALIEAAALRRPSIAALTEPGLCAFYEDIGLKIKPSWPGYIYEIDNGLALSVALSCALRGDLQKGLRRHQDANLPVDGQNAKRVAAFLLQLPSL